MTRDRADEPSCADCGGRPVRMVLATVPLCDRCFDLRISESQGHARLPEPPAPELITGPDRRRHRIHYRLWRAPSGIAVEAAERRRSSEGYFVQVVGPHDADVSTLVDRARATIRQRIGRLDLEPSPSGGHWIIAGDDLTGRLVWRGDEEPYGVVVDGRELSWEEFGLALEPFEGWEFRLTFGDDRMTDDSVMDARQERLPVDDPPDPTRPIPETRVH